MTSHQKPAEQSPSAHEILFGAGTSRWGNNKDTKPAGIRVVLIQRSEKALAALKAIGHPDANVPVKRISKKIKVRAPHLRRANPKHPEQIDTAIVDLMRRAIIDEGCKSLIVRREGISRWLDVPEHSVSQSLERLNKRGLLGPEENRAPHDSDRDVFWGGGGTSAWSGSVRHAHMDKLRALLSLQEPAHPASLEAGVQTQQAKAVKPVKAPRPR